MKGVFAMKQRPSGSMSIKKAIVGFVNDKYAEGLTKRSIDSYERILYRWIKHTVELCIEAGLVWGEELHF